MACLICGRRRAARFELDLGQEIHGVFAAAVDFGVPLLAAEALHFGDGHAGDADLVEGVFDFGELERFDDGFDLFHKLASFRLFSVVVRAFPMLRQIQTGMFFFRETRNPTGDADEFEDEKRGDAAESGGEQDADSLILQLCARLPAREITASPDLKVVAMAIDLGIGKEAEQEQAHRAADAVDAEDIQRIVIAEGLLSLVTAR
jgi:hypothetical protein